MAKKRGITPRARGPGPEALARRRRAWTSKVALNALDAQLPHDVTHQDPLFEQALADLRSRKPRAAQILETYYGLKTGNPEIASRTAESVGVSPSAISHNLRFAHEFLRDHITSSKVGDTEALERLLHRRGGAASDKLWETRLKKLDKLLPRGFGHEHHLFSEAMDALGGVDPRAKEVVERYYGLGDRPLPNRNQVAKAMGIDNHTVKNMLDRAGHFLYNHLYHKSRGDTEGLERLLDPGKARREAEERKEAKERERKEAFMERQKEETARSNSTRTRAPAMRELDSALGLGLSPSDPRFAEGLERLPEQQRTFLRKYFGLDGKKPLMRWQLARLHGLTTQEVKEAIKGGVAGIRDHMLGVPIGPMEPSGTPAPQTSKERIIGILESTPGTGRVPKRVPGLIATLDHFRHTGNIGPAGQNPGYNMLAAHLRGKGDIRSPREYLESRGLLFPITLAEARAAYARGEEAMNASPHLRVLGGMVRSVPGNEDVRPDDFIRNLEYEGWSQDIRDRQIARVAEHLKTLARNKVRGKRDRLGGRGEGT